MVAAIRRNAPLVQLLTVFVPLTLWLGLGDRTGVGAIISLFPPGLGALVYVAMTGALALVLVAAALRHEPDPRAALGLVPIGAGRTIAWGIFAAVGAYLADAVAAGLYVALSRTTLAEEMAAKLRWTSKLAAIPIEGIIPLAVFVGFYEEVLFRGFLLGRLRLLLRSAGLGDTGEVALATVVSAVLFAAGHGYQGPLGLVQTFAMGIVFALVAIRSGSIWPCIVAHTAVDTLGLFVLRAMRELPSPP